MLESAEDEDTSREIILKYSNLSDHITHRYRRTDKQTDGRLAVAIPRSIA